MIIKVQKNNGDWFFVDGVQEVHLNEDVKFDLNHQEPTYWCWRFIRQKEQDTDNPKAQDEQVVHMPIKRIYAQTKYGYYQIDFDTRAYLINDEGKTIERL